MAGGVVMVTKHPDILPFELCTAALVAYMVWIEMEFLAANFTIGVFLVAFFSDASKMEGWEENVAIPNLSFCHGLIIALTRELVELHN